MNNKAVQTIAKDVIKRHDGASYATVANIMGIRNGINETMIQDAIIALSVGKKIESCGNFWKVVG